MGSRGVANNFISIAQLPWAICNASKSFLIVSLGSEIARMRESAKKRLVDKELFANSGIFRVAFVAH
jgi:hypothetical protein